MTESDGIAYAILGALEIAVLRRLGEQRYELLGEVPQFYQRLFPGTMGTPCTTPWRHSEMLDYFVEDAERFFSRNTSGVLNSGIWQEPGWLVSGQSLQASALCLDEEQIFVLRLVSDTQSDKSQVLKRAREQLRERLILQSDRDLYKQRARFDSLTSLFNKAAFMEALEEEIHHASLSGGDLSLLLIDIDDFKFVNESHGHLAGDTILSTIGRILRDFLRRDDMATRYGGEEFAVLAPYTMLHQAVRIAEKLRKVIAEQDFGALPLITVSIGCASLGQGEDAQAFIRRADSALYAAKKCGKNVVKTA